MVFVLMLALLPLTALWDGVTTLTAVCHTIHRCYIHDTSINRSEEPYTYHPSIMLRLHGTAQWD